MSGAPEFLVSADLSPREAARRLGTSEATIWQMIADGRLQSYRLSPKPGGARRIRWEAIEAIRRSADPVEAVRVADLAIAHRMKLDVTPAQPASKHELFPGAAPPEATVACKALERRDV